MTRGRQHRHRSATPYPGRSRSRNGTHCATNAMQLIRHLVEHTPGRLSKERGPSCYFGREEAECRGRARHVNHDQKSFGRRDSTDSSRTLVQDDADVLDRFLSRLSRLTRVAYETRGRARSPLRRHCPDASRQHSHRPVKSRQYRSPTPSPGSSSAMSSIRGGRADCWMVSCSQNALQPQRRRRQAENENSRLRHGGADDCQMNRELQRAFEQLSLEMEHTQRTSKPDDVSRLRLRVEAMMELLKSRGAAENRPTIRWTAGELPKSGPGGARGDLECRTTSIRWADRAT
ncbi:hypothetical protein PpBr36_03410 [Pyricularia pennisetigena]|uniref:hypothetical protein n=1 Tax=Pyricularia pennisetigena TaxID=1578925 RepID=UPI0011540D32|nr:hypothetical protein PpBr36_03410 [Pyricularia pennisetigena]TLS31303.1 hypothetical protein PpBr36_03410 [Pyricularia pennisetigena]